MASNRNCCQWFLFVEEDVYRMKPLSAVSCVDKDDGFSQIRFCSPAASYLF